MALNIQEIADKWEIDKPQYSELGKLVYSFIKKEITAFEILPEISCRTKELLSIIKKIKKKNLKKEYDYSMLNDKLGIRIICTFKEDMDKVDTFIKNSFEVKNTEYKSEKLDFNRLDYISNHYDLTIKPSVPYFSKHTKYSNLVFEIQVRTLNQHAWSNTAHSLSYKQEAEIADGLKRRVYRLLSLYEIADDEFSSVNNALINHPDNLVYSLLRKIESKIYKYAQVDFDRELSLYFLRIFLGYFEEEDKRKLISEIDSFIVANDVKIKQIYEDNKARYYEIPVLTQPEIFVVWYAIENFFFSVDDNWRNDFDENELEQMQNLWGKTIE